MSMTVTTLYGLVRESRSSLGMNGLWLIQNGSDSADGYETSASVCVPAVAGSTVGPATSVSTRASPPVHGRTASWRPSRRSRKAPAVVSTAPRRLTREPGNRRFASSSSGISRLSPVCPSRAQTARSAKLPKPRYTGPPSPDALHMTGSPSSSGQSIVDVQVSAPSWREYAVTSHDDPLRDIAMSWPS